MPLWVSPLAWWLLFMGFLAFAAMTKIGWGLFVYGTVAVIIWSQWKRIKDNHW